MTAASLILLFSYLYFFKELKLVFFYVAVCGPE